MRGVDAAAAPRLDETLVRSARVFFIDHFWIEQKLPAVKLAKERDGVIVDWQMGAMIVPMQEPRPKKRSKKQKAHTGLHARRSQNQQLPA